MLWARSYRRRRHVSRWELQEPKSGWKLRLFPAGPSTRSYCILYETLLPKIFFFLLTIQGKEIGWCNKVSSWVRFQSCEKKKVADRVSEKWEKCWEKQIKVNIVFQGSDSIESLIVHRPDALQILFCEAEL